MSYKKEYLEDFFIALKIINEGVQNSPLMHFIFEYEPEIRKRLM